MSVLLVVIVAAGAVGAVSFFLKLLLTKGVRRIEGMINISITDTTDIANDQVLPERWRDEVNRKVRRLPQERRDEVAKRIVLQRLDRLIGRVERGTAFQEEVRTFACQRLHATRERWLALSWPVIAAEATRPSSDSSDEGKR
mgnify:CR=1 FL=1